MTSLQSLRHKMERNAFAPVVCSILGVVVFMRLGVVVGVLGLYYAAAAVGAAFAITFLSVGSMSALASATEGFAQAGGGLFDALRRSLGHRLGHMIGLMLFLSFCVGAAFYLLGFSELALVVVGVDATKYPLPWNSDASAVTVAIASVILAGLMLGVQVRISLRALKLVFVMVMVAVICNVVFLMVPNVSKHTGLSMARLKENAEHEPKQFRQMFATFFPGFCGVIAGANLAEFVSERSAAGVSTTIAKKASQYFLLGIHKALAFSLLVYVLLGFVLAACVDNHVLQTEPFVVPTVVDSVLGVPLIFLGVASTTISSALSNIKGASTICTTLCGKPRHFEKEALTLTTGLNEMPETLDGAAESSSGGKSGVKQKASRFALLCTWVLCQAGLLCGTVDALVPVVSSMFLLTFFLLNFACFFQDLSSVSFRPSFRMYSKWTAFIGCLLSLSAFFLVVSVLFMSISSILLLGYIGFYHRELTQFVDKLRLSQHHGRPHLHRQDAVDEEILADESTTPLGSCTPAVSNRRGSRQVVDNKRVGLAALYVRDAIHGRFLGDDYLIEGLTRMHYKQLFHGLWYFRIANMCVLMSLTFFETPSWCFYSSSCGDRSKILTWGLPILSQRITIAIELVCLLLLGLELYMKYQYMGPRIYFVDKWHILQIIFVLADFVAVVTVAITPREPNQESARDDKSDFNAEGSKPLVLAPLIRPLILITMSHRLRAGFSSLLRALPRFADGLLTLAILITVYAVLGLLLFVGTAEAEEYFKSFEDGCLSLIILLTTANFPDVMMPIYSQIRLSSLFFVSFLMIGQLLVMNLVFASVYQHYRQEIAERAIEYSTKRKMAFQAAFHLLPAEQSMLPEEESVSIEQKMISRTTYDRLINELMRPSISLFQDDESSMIEDELLHSGGGSNDEHIAFDDFMVLIKAFIARENKTTKVMRAPRQLSHNAIVRGAQRFVTGEWFDKVVDVAILINFVAILVEIQAKIHGEESVWLSWERLMPVFSLGYLLEMTLKMYAFHLGGYFSSAKNIYDCAVTLVIFVAEVSVHSHNIESEWEWVRLLLLFRFLRCLRLLIALQALSSMFSIVVRLIPAFTTLYGMLAVVMFEYAAAGMQLFGGKLVKGDQRLADITYGQSNFYSNNFNDFASSLTTLFELLIVNNWFVTMEGAVVVTSKWSQIYFVSFYVVGVVMVLSLVVAFVVEAYFEDAARSKPTDHISEPSFAGNDSATEAVDTNHNFSSEKTQRLLKARSAFRLRPRADSIYVEEFL